jgi:uncharacterized protein YdiU (UPF0061 family)
MDDFDPSYTPNHDDYALRYSYKNQPTIIWWNLVRLGEALGELLGAGANVDDHTFVEKGVKEEQEAEVVARAEKIITQVGEEYKATFLTEYKRLMTARLGLRNFKEDDFNDLFSEGLDSLEALELDFHHFFRRLSSLTVDELATEEARREKASVFFHKEGAPKLMSETDARDKLAKWLASWRERIIEDWKEEDGNVSEARDEERIRAMKQVNPNFVPRGWILDEVIRRVEKEDEREVLDRIMHMALHPFEDSWDGQTINGVKYEGDKEEETRWTADPPKTQRAIQCSCSS